MFTPALDSEHLHHLIPQTINHLHRNPAGLRFRERRRLIAAERGPGFDINFWQQCRLESIVGIIGSQEVGVAHEEAFFVGDGRDKRHPPPRSNNLVRRLHGSFQLAMASGNFVPRIENWTLEETIARRDSGGIVHALTSFSG